MIQLALQEYGVHESPSSSDSNSRVLEYFAESGNAWVKDDTNNAWCSAFMGFLASKAGLQKTGSLLARSWLNAGQPTDDPEMGDTVILWRDDINGTHGHTGLFVKQDATHVWLLGGNQNDEVNITPFLKSRVLGYRDITKPWPSFSFQSNLKKGAIGEDVKELQKVVGTAQDGEFGPVTEEAVKTFQSLHNLNPDGIVGFLTRKALNETNML